MTITDLENQAHQFFSAWQKESNPRVKVMLAEVLDKLSSIRAEKQVK